MELERNSPGRRRDKKYRAEMLAEEESPKQLLTELPSVPGPFWASLFYCSCLMNPGTSESLLPVGRQVFITGKRHEQTILTQKIYILYLRHQSQQRKKDSGWKESYLIIHEIVLVLVAID